MEITTIGLDLAKRVFQVHGVDAAGAARPSRGQRANRIWPSNCTASLPRPRACAPDRRSSHRPHARAAHDNLLFRKPGSLHLSVLQKAGL